MRRNAKWGLRARREQSGRRVQRVENFAYEEETDEEETTSNEEVCKRGSANLDDMKRLINGFKFKTMIDTFSPLIIIALVKISCICIGLQLLRAGTPSLKSRELCNITA